MVDYGNDKLNEIFYDTWPNLGWAARKSMNNEMPWVNLTQEEVDELRNKKHELTEYGKEKIRKLAQEGISKYNEALQLMSNQEPYPDEMFEEAERREKSNRVLERYNAFYNQESSSTTHGTIITPEFQQAVALDCMVAAIRCEYMNQEFDQVPVSDIESLIEALYQQGRDYLKRVQEFKDSADGVA
jgi:hypothetical protein